MKRGKCALLLLTLVLVFSSVQARDIHAVRASTPVAVDGKIEEPEWPRAAFQGGFIQLEPEPGRASMENTRVAVLFDDKNLYVAFVCPSSGPVVAAQTRRDQLEKEDDCVAVVFDTYHDSRTAFWFMANPLNTQIDARISDDGKTVDTNWDAGWAVASSVADSGWTAEFSIPFTSLRFNPEGKTWGVNFGRFIPRILETSYWAGLTDSDFRVSRFGTLMGVELPLSPSSLRVIPYFTQRYETFSPDPWESMAGVDAEFRYRNNITVNGTFNPDFASVEGDREQINMTRWELSFPEKRKFFLEGGELFKSRITAFYSRRIGEIDFGGKAIGKTGPYTYALIGVRGKSVSDNPATSGDESFPAYNLGVVRLTRDVLKSSSIGLLMVDKTWEGGSSRVFGVDGVFNLPYSLYCTTQLVAGAPGPFDQNYGGFVRLARENNVYHYHLRYTEYAEHFRESVNGIGYIKDDNRRELDSAVEYKWWLKKPGLEFLSYKSNYNIYWAKTDGRLRSWAIDQGVELYFRNKIGLALECYRQYELFEKGFDNLDVKGRIGYNTQEWSSTELSGQFGRNYARDYWMATFSTRHKIHDKLSVEYEVENLQFTPDPKSESTWLHIGTVQVSFTPDLFIRLFLQHRSASDRLYVYGLFGWRFRLPNSAVYLVYTRDDSYLGDPEKQKTEILFMKLAYDFGIF